MDEVSFFSVLEKQYNSQLPFVVYSRPINNLVKCWLQKDDTLHTTETYTESGFVFAPFDIRNESVLLPENECELYTLEVNTLKVEEKISDFEATETQKNEHIDLVSKGIAAIKKGDLKKVVLSRIETKDLSSADSLSIFKKLYNKYKNAMVYCWYHPKVGLWLGATPELLFQVEGKQLTTISLAGTQPYKRVSKVTWTNKEIEEQQIVTDYIAHQIEPFSKPINISDVETIRAGSLLHLKSRITGLINDTAELKSIIQALHPTPAVCGFPKQDAKDFILKNENYNREFYTGFLGELNLKHAKTRNKNRRNIENNAYTVVKKQSNFYVNLRCMQLKDHKALIYVGGGITKDSVAKKEWEETINKTKTIGNVLE